MNALHTRSAGIHRLLESVAEAYGPDAFPLDGQQPASPEHVVLTSARDRRFSVSIIAQPEQPGQFSVMVELYDPPEPELIPFEIAEDGEFNLAEVVELLGRYRDCHRPEQGATPDGAVDGPLE
jgi:hypothetical protein